MLQMAFFDLSHTFHKQVTNVSQHDFVHLLWGILTSPFSLIENCENSDEGHGHFLRSTCHIVNPQSRAPKEAGAIIKEGCRLTAPPAGVSWGQVLSRHIMSKFNGVSPGGQPQRLLGA